MTETVEIRLLTRDDANLLQGPGAEIFDHPIDPAATEAFLADERHHIAMALAEGRIVGFASAVHYLHPDKPRPELWINEVDVASGHRGRGVGKRLIASVIEAGRRLGCAEAWVLTDSDNIPAKRLYAACGGREAPAVMFSFALDP